MDSTPSPIETLRQLRAMLDAGTLTTAEFEALKQKLVFGSDPITESTPPVAPSQPLATEPIAQAAFLLEVPEAPLNSPAFPPSPEERTAAAPDDYLPADAPPASRNYLNLVLSIGGLIALLGIVLYLNLHPRESEHIGSTSQTAADSVKAVEVGPQAEQIALPPPAPETVRIAPAHPAVPIQRPSRALLTDSVDSPTVAGDSAI